MSQTATSLFLRGMPRDVIRLAKTEAARRGETLGAVVASVLREGLGGSAAPDELANDLAWFEANRARLAKRYRGEFVAVLRGRVVDHDARFDLVTERVFARFGVRSMLITRATAKPVVAHVRSPRVARR